MFHEHVLGLSQWAGAAQVYDAPGQEVGMAPSHTVLCNAVLWRLSMDYLLAAVLGDALVLPPLRLLEP